MNAPMLMNAPWPSEGRPASPTVSDEARSRRARGRASPRARRRGPSPRPNQGSAARGRRGRSARPSARGPRPGGHRARASAQRRRVCARRRSFRAPGAWARAAHGQQEEHERERQHLAVRRAEPVSRDLAARDHRLDDAEPEPGGEGAQRGEAKPTTSAATRPFTPSSVPVVTENGPLGAAATAITTASAPTSAEREARRSGRAGRRRSARRRRPRRSPAARARSGCAGSRSGRPAASASPSAITNSERSLERRPGDGDDPVAPRVVERDRVGEDVRRPGEERRAGAPGSRTRSPPWPPPSRASSPGEVAAG